MITNQIPYQPWLVRGIARQYKRRRRLILNPTAALALTNRIQSSAVAFR